MKKWIALLLALVMCLTLCACGGGDNAAQQDGGDAAADGLYQIGDTAEGAQFSFTLDAIRNLKYIEGGRLNHATESSTGKEKLVRHDVEPNEGYTILRLQFTVGYSGKEKQNIDLKNCLTLDYDDGYTFTPAAWNEPMPTTQDAYSGYYDFNDGDLELNISDPLGYKAELRTVYIFVNNEVVEQVDKPLVLKVDLPGEEEIVFNARANLTEEEQQEENYQAALELMEGHSRLGFLYAMEYLKDLGDYKDSAELYKDAELRYHMFSYGKDESKQFLQDHLDSFTILTGDQISALMPGTYKLSSGSTNWDFHADGVIEDGFNNGRTWAVDGDKLTLASNVDSYTYTVYQPFEGAFILIDESQPDGLCATQYMFVVTE